MKFLEGYTVASLWQSRSWSSLVHIYYLSLIHQKTQESVWRKSCIASGIFSFLPFTLEAVHPFPRLLVLVPYRLNCHRSSLPDTRSHLCVNSPRGSIFSLHSNAQHKSHGFCRKNASHFRWIKRNTGLGPSPAVLTQCPTNIFATITQQDLYRPQKSISVIQILPRTHLAALIFIWCSWFQLTKHNCTGHRVWNVQINTL